ncbi:MAG: hypothetical protein JWO38_1121 [Gemmataceae bacterium]|nr:hypothetical protein [Gemmataceae bacterium]
MATTLVEIVWRGEVVGYIENPGLDNFHLYGIWVSVEGQVATQFLSELAVALERWDEDTAGVRVRIGKNLLRPGEVTGLSEGVINVLMLPQSE